MPAPGQPVERWLDRSGLGNDIVAHNLGSLPRVQRDPVGPIIEIEEPGHVLRTAPGPAMRLGIEDFAVLVLARCDANTVIGSLFDKQSGERPRAGLSLNCNHPGDLAVAPMPNANNRMFLELADAERLTGPGDGVLASQRTFDPGGLHLVVARRHEGKRLQLRVDGKLEAEGVIASAANLWDEKPAFVGAQFSTLPGLATMFNGGLAAVIVVRGSLLDAELEALEAFLLATMGPGAPAL